MKRAISIALILAFAAVMMGFAAFAEDEYSVKTTASVNIRKGPSTGYAIITSVVSGKTFGYAGVSKYDSGGMLWHKINYKSSTAWISGKYSRVVCAGVTLSASAYVKATANVNLRKGPGSGYAKLGSLSKGAKAYYLGQTTTTSTGYKWHKVATSAGIAWVSGSYSSVSGGTASAPAPSTGAAVVTTGSVNLRNGPGLSCTIYTSVKKGVTLTYLGETSTDNRGVKWYKVSYKGRDLWISSVYSKIK